MRLLAQSELSQAQVTIAEVRRLVGRDFTLQLATRFPDAEVIALAPDTGFGET
jgi:hypothetical protein